MQEWHNETNEKDFSEYEGFIYKILFTDGTVYFGKKNFIKRLTLPPLKGTKRKRKVVKESDWRKYEGSSKEKGNRVVQKKIILKLARTKGRLTYLENQLLYKENVLLRIDCLNNNISGKIWAKTISREPIKWSTKCQ